MFLGTYTASASAAPMQRGATRAALAVRFATEDCGAEALHGACPV